MGTDIGSRSRRLLLTFRVDRDLRQRLRTRLAGDGRTMSEVVILGLQLYVQHSASMAGSATLDRASPAPAERPESPAPAERPALTGPTLDRALAAPAEPPAAAGPGPATTAVASPADLVLPDHIASYLRDLRESGQSDLLSATLAGLHDVGWPLRPLAAALGITRQAVQARTRQQVSAEVRSQVPDVPPPSAFPRRRPALASGRRPHLTIKVDQALRTAAHRQARREGSSLSQVIEKILNHYLHHGMPAGPVELGDTTPTRPAPRRRHRAHVPSRPSTPAQ
jgi:antitoxin component of RelBE/YafQ-DinJ toxin-antitoxin module